MLVFPTVASSVWVWAKSFAYYRTTHNHLTPRPLSLQILKRCFWPTYFVRCIVPLRSLQVDPFHVLRRAWEVQSQGICVSPGAAANTPKLSIQLSAQQINKDETTESHSVNLSSQQHLRDGWCLERARACVCVLVCIFQLLPVTFSINVNVLVYSYFKLPFLEPAALIMSVRTHRGPERGEPSEVSHPLYCICICSIWKIMLFSAEWAKEITSWPPWMSCLKVIIMVLLYTK